MAVHPRVRPDGPTELSDDLLEQAAGGIAGQLDSMSDLQDSSQLHLAQSGVRQGQAEATASNLRKKFSDTSSGIVQNFK